MRIISRLAALVVLCTLAAPSQAATLLSDNFNSENGGVGALNYTGFANWTVSGVGGSVDLIGNGFFDFYPGNGLYVDLNGSTSASGLMTSKQVFAPGTYQLQFDLGGSQRGDSNDVTVTFGAYTEVFTKASGDPLTTVTRTITLLAPAALSFQNDLVPDQSGAILDNVVVSDAAAVPEPSTLTLLGTGIAGALGYGWRRKTKAVA